MQSCWWRDVLSSCEKSDESEQKSVVLTEEMRFERIYKTHKLTEFNKILSYPFFVPLELASENPISQSSTEFQHPLPEYSSSQLNEVGSYEVSLHDSSSTGQCDHRIPQSRPEVSYKARVFFRLSELRSGTSHSFEG